MAQVQFQKQKFYIVAHNPNTIADAKIYLDAGVNALEPDVCFSSKSTHPDRYYVSHDHLSTNPDSYDFDHEHSLANYMQQLAALLASTEKSYDLALIWFDYKDSPEGDINEMLKIVQNNFSSVNAKCAGVAIMVSVAHIGDGPFVNGYDQTIDNAGVAIDQDDDSVGVKKNFTDALETRFAYADGIMV